MSTTRRAGDVSKQAFAVTPAPVTEPVTENRTNDTDDVLKKYIKPVQRPSYRERKKQVGVWLENDVASTLNRVSELLRRPKSEIAEDALIRFFNELREAGVI